MKIGPGMQLIWEYFFKPDTKHGNFIFHGNVKIFYIPNALISEGFINSTLNSKKV